MAKLMIPVAIDGTIVKIAATVDDEWAETVEAINKALTELEETEGIDIFEMCKRCKKQLVKEEEEEAVAEPAGEVEEEEEAVDEEETGEIDEERAVRLLDELLELLGLKTEEGEEEEEESEKDIFGKQSPAAEAIGVPIPPGAEGIEAIAREIVASTVEQLRQFISDEVRKAVEETVKGDIERTVREVIDKVATDIVREAGEEAGEEAPSEEAETPAPAEEVEAPMPEAEVPPAPAVEEGEVEEKPAKAEEEVTEEETEKAEVVPEVNEEEGGEVTEGEGEETPQLTGEDIAALLAQLGAMLGRQASKELYSRVTEKLLSGEKPESGDEAVVVGSGMSGIADLSETIKQTILRKLQGSEDEATKTAEEEGGKEEGTEETVS